MVFPQDLARIRYENAMLLFDEFVRATVAAPDAATLRGLERRFAERLQIQPSYWSQIKSRSRQIGERLARQFEQLCRKPAGWMDQPHGATGTTPAPGPQLLSATGTAAGTDAADQGPRDDDERFIVGLVLTYYRRHPQRARTRLLDLLGEVLTPPTDAGPAAVPSRGTGAPARPTPPPPAADDRSLWSQVQAGVAPLKKKR